MTKILQMDADVLRKVAHEVPPGDIGTPKLNKILGDMKKALATQDDGVAIAAPQIGVSLRIFVVSHKIFEEEGNDRVQDRVFINPVIKKRSRKKEDMDEGCLSVRWKYGSVKRATNVTLQARDESGSLFTYNATGLLAQIFQHETDHLEGILFTDKAKDVRDIDPEELKQRTKNT